MKSFLFVICLYSLHWGAILEPQGKIPHRFLESPQESFERKLSQSQSQSLSQSDLDKYKTEFFELSEFESKYFILSGKVIFGDEATLLMQKIVDQLIQNAQLGIKVEVYTIKSPVVNAFATEDNVIMVNLGLLTKVENEATLAFILSHELAHIVKDHVIENYIEQHKIKNQEDQYQNLRDEFIKSTQAKFSQSTEKEADLLGYEIFKKTYSNDQGVQDAFELLNHSHHTINDQPFQASSLHQLPWQIQDNQFNSEYPAYTSNVKDPLSTHPDIEERIQLLPIKAASIQSLDSLEQHSRSEGMLASSLKSKIHNSYIISLLDHYYFHKAIFEISGAIREQGFTPTLERLHARAWYEMAIRKKKNYFDDQYQAEGPLYTWKYFYEKSSLESILLAALYYNRSLKLKFPDENIWTEQEYFLLKELRLKSKKSFKQIFLKKNYKKVKWTDINESEIKAVFNKWLTDEPFLDQIKTILAIDPQAQDVKYKTRQSLAYQTTSSVLNNSIQIDSILLINPQVRSLDLRKKQPKQYLGSQNKTDLLHDIFQKSSDKLDLHLKVLSPKNIQATEIKKFYAMTDMEQLLKVMLLNTDKKYTLWHKERFIQASQVVGYSKVSFAGFIDITTARNYQEFMGILYIGAYYLPITPFAMYEFFQDKVETFSYQMVIDTQTGELLFSRVETIPWVNDSGLMKSLIYGQLWQLKHPEES